MAFNLDMTPGIRVIDWLREHLPFGAWRWDRIAHEWVCSTGLRVYRRAAMAPQYDGDDETHTLHYFRSDTGEQILFLGGDYRRNR